MRLSSLRSLSCLSSFATFFSSAAAAGRAGAATAAAQKRASTNLACLIFPRRGQMMPRFAPPAARRPDERALAASDGRSQARRLPPGDAFEEREHEHDVADEDQRPVAFTRERAGA